MRLFGGLVFKETAGDEDTSVLVMILETQSLETPGTRSNLNIASTPTLTTSILSLFSGFSVGDSLSVLYY